MSAGQTQDNELLQRGGLSRIQQRCSDSASVDAKWGSLAPAKSKRTGRSFVDSCRRFPHIFWTGFAFGIGSILSLYLGHTLIPQFTPQFLKSPPFPAKMQISVLCFGASITAGWSAGGSKYYPYSTRLLSRLSNELPADYFDLKVDGVPGDTIIQGQYRNRMTRDIENAGNPYDWVM